MDKNVKGAEDADITDKKYLVAFLDILGFKDYVKKCLDEKDFESLNKSGEILEETISNSIELPKNRIDFKEKEIKYNQFSDCIYVAIPYLDRKNKSFIDALVILIVLLRTYQSTMFRGNFYVRGGISLGFHLESQRIVFSEGLINAYKLESEKAIYPRIILDDNVIKYIKDIFDNEKERILNLGIDKILLSDWDDTVFINPFSWDSTQIKSLEMEKSFRKGIQIFFDANNLEMPQEIENMAANDLLSLVTQFSLSFVSKNVKNRINELKNRKKDSIVKHSVLKKYLWLNELIKWNQDPNSSKIKFEYFLK